MQQSKEKYKKYILIVSFYLVMLGGYGYPPWGQDIVALEIFVGARNFIFKNIEAFDGQEVA